MWREFCASLLRLQERNQDFHSRPLVSQKYTGTVPIWAPDLSGTGTGNLRILLPFREDIYIFSSFFFLRSNVLNPNRLKLDPDPRLLPNFDPDPGPDHDPGLQGRIQDLGGGGGGFGLY